MSSPSRTQKVPQPTWWSRSSDAGQALLIASALFARPLPVAWTTAWGVDDTEVDDLLAAGVLQEDQDGLMPTDASMRDRVIALAPWSQRKRAHLRLAAACLTPPTRLESAAHHFAQGGNNEEAARAYLGAAEAHCRRHHHAAAKRCFMAGLTLLPENTPDASVIAALQNLGRCAALAPDVDAAARDQIGRAHV